MQPKKTKRQIANVLPLQWAQLTKTVHTPAVKFQERKKLTGGRWSGFPFQISPCQTCQSTL